MNPEEYLYEDHAIALARPGDMTRSCLRVEKAEKGLGWCPRNDLRQGIQQTLEWWANAPSNG